MRANHVSFSLLLCLTLGTRSAPAQSWNTLTNSPPAGIELCLLLTDGSVLCEANVVYKLARWYKLQPDLKGSYLNGTWSAVASMPLGFAPDAAAEAVLADGRVVFVGGEYNNSSFALTNLGAIYDPKADSWTMIPAPPFDHFVCIGDAPSIVLADGRFLIGSKLFQDLAVLDPATLTWSLVASTGKTDKFNSEEGWTLLPDGSFFTLDVANAPSSERFLLTGTTNGVWASAGNTPQDLHTPTTSGPITAPGCPVYNPPGEVGPTLLRPDGTVFAVGADGLTGIYTPPAAGSTGAGTWAMGPAFPQGLTVEDGPGVVLPSGHILTMARPPTSSGVKAFEFDGTNLDPVPSPSNAGASLLLLPTGQVMSVDGSTTVQLYTAAASPTYDPAWAPAITSVATSIAAGGTYKITGTQFNGLNQGTAYGDEFENATNYPLVRITNQATGHVFYARTHDHSSMGVATGTAAVLTSFDVPPDIEAGAGTLEVVANSIPSPAVAVNVSVPSGGVAPVVTTGQAAAVGGSSATLNGSANPDGADTQVWFEYGTDSSMNGSIWTPKQDVGSGQARVAFSAQLAGLTGGTYYYRAWATNSMGASYGDVATFTQVRLPDGYSNLGPGTSYAASLWCITGAARTSCGTAERRAVATPFTPAGSFSLGSISVALGWVSGSNGANIYLLQDASGLPGKALESWTVNNLPGYPGGLATVNDQLGLTLQAGQQYWLEVAAPGSDTLLYWSNSFVQPGNAWTSINGGPWQENGPGSQPAFAVGPGGPPAINPGGVVGASAFGESAAVAPGDWIEIYGLNLAPDTRPWAGSDFNGAAAPTQLDGTSVTIGGLPAFVSYISPGQVNVQVPDNVGTGSQPIVITSQAGGASNVYAISVNAVAPGLLAPPSFNVGGNQYAAALFPDFSTYALPGGAVAGLNSRPAHPGDTIILYGVGFGPVTPGMPAGQVAQQVNTLATPYQFFVGGAQAAVSYGGRAPGYVGLYQFNIVVPSVPAGNLVPVTFTLGGVTGKQTLYIAVN